MDRITQDALGPLLVWNEQFTFKKICCRNLIDASQYDIRLLRTSVKFMLISFRYCGFSKQTFKRVPACDGLSCGAFDVAYSFEAWQCCNCSISSVLERKTCGRVG